MSSHAFGATAFEGFPDLERIGKIYLSDFFLSPRYSYTEPHTGSFNLGESYIAADWTKGDELSAHFAFGTKALINVPAWYGPVPDQDLGLVEAFAQAQTDYGRVRFGLMPIPFGLEAGVNEADLRFERSLLFQNHLVGLRDIGLGYYISNGGISSEWLISNGEGGADLDNQLWFTARWGYRTRKIWTGISAQTGHTTPVSTDPSGIASSGYAGLNVDQNSQIRMGNAFFSFKENDLEVETEFTVGKILQTEFQHQFTAGHLDVFTPFVNGPFAALLRYDYLDQDDPNHSTTQQYTLGACWRAQYETSSVYLFGSRIVHPGPGNDEHQVLLIWRVTPLASIRY